MLSVHFSPDGKHLATGSGDTTVRFWDLNTQTPYKEGCAHRAWVMACSWSPDAALLATGDKDGTVCVWEAVTSECSGSCRGHTKWITSIAWQPVHLAAPCRKFASSSKDGTVRVWEPPHAHSCSAWQVRAAPVPCPALPVLRCKPPDSSCSFVVV